MNAAPLSTVAPETALIADGVKSAQPAHITKSDLPETIAGTVREYTKFEVGKTLEVEGVKFKIHDVTDQRLVLKFVHKQR